MVTGGAGFIGSNFVRRTLDDAYPGLEGAEVTVLDALTYSGNLANLEPVADSARYGFVHGDIRDRAAAGCRAAGRRRDRAFRRRVARRPLGAGCRGLRRDQRARHAAPARRRARARRRQVRPRLHRRGVRVDRRRGRGPRTTSSSRTPHTRRRRPAATSSRAATTAPTGCTSRSRAARTTTGRTTSPRRSSRCSSRTSSTASTCRCTATARTFATGCTSTTTHAGSPSCSLGGRAGEIYNIGGGTELTNRELTQKLLDATGRDWSFVDQVEDRKGHDRRYSVDIAKIRGELGYEPLVPFDAGLADVVQWYRDHRAWWEPLKERAAL